jgi:serine phosphatase RsbU (regulator of sigma subunit)
MIDSKQDNKTNIKNKVELQKIEHAQSLKYASYIQKAILPPESMLARFFPQHFLLYIPRDIVGGDFYWISKKGPMVYLAVADCTGHGVPGAFLSILGISFLHQIIDRYDCYTASGVLNSLREFFMKSLNQTGSENEQKDGIDMGFCIIDSETKTLQYAGAFNPLYIIKKGNQLIEIAGDKMPIGIAADSENSFTNHIINLDVGDMIYLFSDGFVDQFGGPFGKKFKYRPFRNQLLSICELHVEKQKLFLVEALNSWKGKLPQLDDILIFGFRYT